MTSSKPGREFAGHQSFARFSVRCRRVVYWQSCLPVYAAAPPKLPLKTDATKNATLESRFYSTIRPVLKPARESSEPVRGKSCPGS